MSKINVMKFISVSKLGNGHSDWLRALDFYREELGILELRLAEVMRKNTGSDFLAGVEHFQNQFIVQKNNIDEFRHAIKENLQKAGREALAYAGYVEADREREHDALMEDFMGLEKVIMELRHDFNRFLSKWM